MKRILTLLALILGFVFQGQSQLLTANQCESSPCNARAICGSTISTTYSYATTPASNPIGTCVSSTGTFAYSSNWVYYRFTCYSTGTFTMKLNSNDSATVATDLDWAMWDITTSGCSALTTANVVECNAAGAGSTGIFTGGTPSANYENNVTITAGNTYIIGISNPTGTNTGGFTMNFGGTASITDNKKPYMASILPFDPCSPVTSIKIKLSEPVRCDQLNAGVDYTLSPAAPAYTAAAAGCSGCTNAAPNTNPNFYGNATDTVVLTFATALTPGTYTITPVANAWRDLCLNADSTTATLTFIVPAPFKDTVRSGFDCLTLKYIDTVYGVNGLSPYQYKAVGGGLAASFGTYGPVGGTPGYTIYTVSGGTPVIYSVKDNGGCEVDTTLNRPSVLAMSSPNLSASANPPCHDQFALDSITSINQTGGTGPYTFSLAPTYPWTFVAPNKWKNINFSPALGVTFTVTVTDAHGCTKTGVKNLVNPTVVNLLLATPTNPQCNGDSTGKICFGQATGGTPLYTYTINPSYPNTTFTTSPSNCFNNLPSGTYTVTALDANSCSATGTKTLSQPAVITINTSAATIVNPTCPANCNGTYQPVGNGGTGPKKFYKYPYIGPGLWDYSDSVVSGIAPNNKFDSLCAGTYTVIAKDALGCTATATFTLALPISPVMNIGTITPVACFGGVGTIAVNITSATTPYTAANYTYQVAPVAGMGVTVSGAGGINGLYTGVPVGTYDLIITNANACADTVFGVTMTQPPSPVSYASVVVDSVLCFGSATGNITAQATGGTVGANSYQYSIKIGAAPFTPYSAPQLTPYTFTNLAAGTYTIRVRDHNLCTKDSIVTIYQPTKLNLLLDEVEATCFGTSDGEICVVDTGGVNDFRYKLGIAGAYSAFQPAGLVYCFSNLAAGNYSVYTIDIKGCLDTLAVTVAAIPLPVVSYTAAPNDTVCDGTSVTLSGTGADSYAWTGGIFNGNPFTPTLGTTQYIVTGLNTTTGCENKDTAFVLVNPIPVMNPINNQIVCNNTATLAVFPGSSVATSSYAWSHDATAAIGIGTSGTGSIPSFIAVNTGITPIVVTFTVTPTGPAITNCVGADITFTITINPDAHIAMDPASGSNTQTVCIGQPINDIIYNITGGGTGAGVSATLPTGVTGSFLGGVFTISGTPTGPAGIYPYTVTTTGTCAQVTATGTITVSPDAIITQTSPIGTQAQLLCINSNLTTISYSITGTGTGAIVTGLPVGVFQNYTAGTLTITGSPAIAAFYTYTVTATGTCGSATTTGTIDVTPLQDPSFTYSSPTFCTTGINPLPSITGSTGGTFSASPAGLSINPITGLINLSASISPVTYTVKYVTAGPCPDSSTFNVTITNAPSAVFSYSPVSYCQNGSNPLPIFQLVPPASGGVFSATPAGLDLNPGTGEVNLATSASGTYTVTNFIAAAGGCASASATATIVIDSTTIVTPPTNIVVCNNVTVPTINFSSTVPGTTYTWVSNFDLGMGLNGITNIPTFTALNTTNLPITATVTIIPTGPTPNFCDGLPVDFTITVNPDAFIALDPASGSNTQTVCIGQPINDIIYNISGGGTGAGVSATLPAGVTGSFLGGVFTISGTPTGPAGIYPYTVTTTGTCAQTTATGTITVSPDAILTLTSPIGSDNQTVCINTAITNITYSITGTGNNATVAFLPSAGLSYTYVAGILTISGSPSVAGSTTYTVTATGTCGSTTTTFVINVTPLQDPSFTYPSASYCQTGVDPLPAITGSIGGTFSATPAGLVINASTGLIDLSASTINCYTIKYLTAGPCPDSSTFALCVTNPPTAGFSYSPASYCQSGVDPSPVLAAGASAGTFSSTPGLVIDPTTGVIDLSASASGTYTVTNDIAPAGGCAAASATTSVTIDSTTILSAVPNVSVCNGIATAPINFTPTVGGTTYAWSHNGTGIGIATPGTGNIPSFTAINTGTTPIVVTFTVTPTGPTPNFCVGLPITFDITINPDAHIALDPASGSITQTVCIGQPINDIIYNITGGGTGATVSGLPTGVTGSFSSGAFTIAGSPTGPAGIYPGTVTTTGTCAQTTSTFTITVSPDATVTLTSPLPTAAQMVCENTAITNITYAIGGTGTGATASGLPAGITGAYAGGVFTISGSSNAPGIYVYTVTATGTCGSSTASGSIEIVPTQLAGFTYSSSTYCQTGTDPLPIFGAGTAAGGTFSATPAGLVINASTGLIDLSASTLASYVVKYVTPGPCPDSATFNIQITLAPCATFTYAAASYCQSGVDPLPTFGANCSAGTFTATPVGLSINPTTGQVDLSLSNAGTYTVTNDILAAGGCAAANASTTITIDSNTVMNDPVDQAICNGANTTLVVPGGAVAGSTFTWTNSNTGIGLAAANGTGNVPLFTGVNNTSAPVSTTITYTPTGPTGCPGVQQSFTITVNPDAKLTLTSAAATTNQSVCINTAITNIVYTIGGTGNNATVAGLPTGVTAAPPVGNVLTISGTPTVAGTYTYTVTATGTCGSTTSTGTIVVNPNATVTLTSAVGTDAQTVCLFSNITAITYTVGATGTGSTVTGLPPGVTASGSTSISITGAPTAVGSYTYTVTATGTCGSATTTGVINVTPLQDPSFSYPSSTICNTGSACPTPGSIVTPGGVFSVTPALSAAVFNTSTGCFTLPVATTGAYTVKYVTPGPCKDSSTTIINIVTAPCTQFAYGATSYCQSSPNPSPIYTGACTPGVFTASPVGLSINSTNGLINLLASTAGTYTVTNTIAASGTCPASQSTFTVTVVSKPTFTFVSSTPANCTLPCNGSVVSTITGGTGTYTCTISPATAPAAVSNTGTATGLCAGVTYTITATDGIGCSGTTTVSVGTATAPIISIASQTNTTAPFPTCDGTATTLTTSGSGSYAYTIAGPGAPIINAAGFASALCGDTACVTYTIIVTDNNTGCKDTTPVCIFAPGLLNCSASHTNVTCFGGTNGTLADTVSGGTPPYIFVDLTSSSGSVPYTVFSSTVITASGLAAGTYVATWKDSNNITCTSNITITQPAIYSFTLPTISKPSCSPGCDGTLSISASGGTGALSYSIQTPVGVTCTATQSTPGNFSGLGVGVYTVTVTDVNSCTGTITVTINASTPPTITISHNNPSCNNVCDGSATAVGLGGTGTLTYSIQSPAGATCVPTQSAPTSGSFTTLGGGIYTVTVTDTKGCTASDTETLVNPPAILIDTLTHSNVQCNGGCDGTIHVVASGGTGPLSYTLNPGAITNTTGDFIALCAGTYTISAHDANCNKTSTVVISQPSALAWVTTTSTNITCAGSANGIINTVANGGTNPIQYSKDGVTFGGSGNFTALLAGSYTITAKDAHGCTITTSFTIVEPPVLTLGLPSVQQISCNGANDGSITIAAGGGTPGYVYNIVPAAAGSNTTGVFTGLPPGTYTITVTDTVGCSKPSAGITVSQPAPLIFTLVNHQDVACFGGNTGSITVNTSGGTPGITYTINPVVGVQSPPGYFSGLTAGIYNVIATDAHNCSVSSIVNVTEGPEIIIVNFTMTEPVCNGDANGSISFTVIGGTGQLKYQLNGGPLQTDTVFNNLIAGNYLLTIIDALGCTKDQVISVKEPEPVGAIIDLHETNCTDSKDGKAIIIGTGGRGGYKYYVTPGLHINKSGIFTGLEAGSYLLRVVDTSGCEYRTNFVINPPANPLSNTITKQDLACNGAGNEGTATANVAGGTPPYTYLWSTTPPQVTPQASTLFYGYYDVTVMDANGCTLKDTIYIEEGPCCDVAFIPNAFSPNGDQLNDEFKILTTAGVELIKLEIYDRWGKRVWSTIDFHKGWDGMIEGRDAANDTYYFVFRYKCTRDNLTYTKKGDLILIR